MKEDKNFHKLAPHENFGREIYPDTDWSGAQVHILYA